MKDFVNQLNSTHKSHKKVKTKIVILKRNLIAISAKFSVLLKICPVLENKLILYIIKSKSFAN